MKLSLSSARARSVLLGALALAAAPLATAHADGARAPAATTAIVQRGPHEYEVTRADVAALVDRRARAARARVVPELKDGKPTGFRLYAVQADGPFAKLGLRNGDVVRSLNGLPVTTPEQALVAYDQAKQAARVVLGISREGAPLELVYVLK